MFKEPGTFGFVRQLSLFGRGIGGGRTIDFNISGPDLEQVIGVAQRAAGMISQHLPLDQGHQLRPIPGLELGAPEVRIYPDRARLSEIGVTAAELGATVDAFNDGLRVAEITVDGKRIDLMLTGPQRRVTETQGIENLPVVTSGGLILPVSSVADVVVTSGPTEIRHLERGRTITLQVAPSPDMALEAAMEILRGQITDKLVEDGLPPGVKIRLSGTADKLTETWDHMVVDLILAVVIVYLVMAVLFESFIYPLIILLSVPLATAGGVGGLTIVNLFQFQSLDMLTLLGFVILIGIVVNNAILLVHQTLLQIRQEGMDGGASIIEATRNRIRPIFMSTLTSVFGMLPLVAVPGAGSELYRGLGSVVVGGLALSAVLTLLIIPPLLSLVVPFAERRVLQRQGAVSHPAE
jgi:HAE1 family hydrophobic/amphiphilic exporter-1